MLFLFRFICFLESVFLKALFHRPCIMGLFQFVLEPVAARLSTLVCLRGLRVHLSEPDPA